MQNICSLGKFHAPLVKTRRHKAALVCGSFPVIQRQPVGYCHNLLPDASSHHPQKPGGTSVLRSSVSYSPPQSCKRHVYFAIIGCRSLDFATTTPLQNIKLILRLFHLFCSVALCLCAQDDLMTLNGTRRRQPLAQH